MATDREASFPIEDFMGVNRQVDREDIQGQQFYSVKNMWEKKLGVIETRNGSEALLESLPSNIKSLGSVSRIYKNENDKERIVQVHCTRDDEIFSALPTGMGIEWIPDASGNWLSDVSADFRVEPYALVLRFHGFGINKFFVIKATDVTGYTAANTPSKLRITVTQALDNNITGIEVISVIKNGTIHNKVSDPNYNEMAMWAGHCDLFNFPTGDAIDNAFDFYTGPVSRTAGAGVVNTGSNPRTFVLEPSFHPQGQLEVGKTYYVMILPQYLNINTAASGVRASCYRQTDMGAGDVIAITIPEGKNAFQISSILPNTAVYMVAIGEHPQLLIPHSIGHSATGTILAIPRSRPGLIDIKHTSDTLSTYQFRHNDNSLNDMFINVKDDGTYEPVFVNRLHIYQEEATIEDYFIESDLDPGVDPDAYLKQYDWRAELQILGDESKLNYVDWREYAFFVSDHDPKKFEGETAAVATGDFTHKSGTAYYMTDGITAGAVVHDYQTGTDVRLPSGRYIEYFKGSIVITGGDKVVDKRDSLVSDSSRTVFFSRALNPFDFTVPGAPSPSHQFFTVEEGGERTTGISLYTNTTGTAGPISQLVVAKRNALWLITELPVASSGSLPATFMTNLSKKTGGLHLTFVNTPLGLMVANYENVYLLRQSGEPSPIGDAISTILQGSRMENAVACYHDEHYKLSFYNPDEGSDTSENNMELWLDLRKMKAMQGQPVWVGPMTGRNVDSVIVEDLEGDGESFEEARDRVAVGRNDIVIYKADVTPHETDDKIYDLEFPVISELETKDYEISKEDNNWNKLLKRTYWKARTNRASNSPLVATEETIIDGVSRDIQTLKWSGISGLEFPLQPLSVFPHFPTGRIRGRTVRKKLTTEYRVGLGGFSLFYQVERRRI